jgi:hypothetical protein
MKRDEKQETTIDRGKMMAMISKVRTAQSAEELLAMQREVDAIIRETLACYDDDAIEEEDLAAFELVLALFNHAVTERRAEMDGGTLELARLRAR